MRIPHRQIDFPADFVKLFTDLFPQKEGAHNFVHKALAKGSIDAVAAFLLGQAVKFSAYDIRDALQEDGTLNPEFTAVVERGCAIADLYKDVMRLMPS